MTTPPGSTSTPEPPEAPQRQAQTKYVVNPLFHGNQYRASRLPEGHSSRPHAISCHDLTHVAIAAQTAEERGETWERGNRKPLTRERDHSVDRITIRLPQRLGRALRQHLKATGETQTAFFVRLLRAGLFYDE